ncbi:MAG TPA: portal protein, partial [Vicinamibacterales bacterium]|nr:portal protein [Vicinamibacterales bacterium]
HGIDLKVEYISVMAQAQKLVGVVGLDRFLQSSMLLAERFPSVLKKVNVFQAVNDYQDMLGTNPKLVISDEDAQAAVDAEQQAAQQAMAAEQGAKLAQGAAALGKTPLGNNTALDAMLNATGATGIGA